MYFALISEHIVMEVCVCTRTCVYAHVHDHAQRFPLYVHTDTFRQRNIKSIIISQFSNYVWLEIFWEHSFLLISCVQVGTLISDR